MNELDRKTLAAAERGEFKHPETVEDPVKPVSDETLREMFPFDTAGDRERFREFIEELDETGRLMKKGDVDGLVAHQVALSEQPTGRMHTIDSVGHIPNVIDYHQIPDRSHKRRRAEKAAKKRVAKNKRSQYAREMGMI